jgi:hypothetical protein
VLQQKLDGANADVGAAGQHRPEVKALQVERDQLAADLHAAQRRSITFGTS